MTTTDTSTGSTPRPRRTIDPLTGLCIGEVLRQGALERRLIRAEREALEAMVAWAEGLGGAPYFHAARLAALRRERASCPI